MDNIVKLVFKTDANTSGFDKLVKGGAQANQTLNRISGAARTMGHIFGPLGGIVGGALGSFVQGNIWQAAALGAGFFVAKLGLLTDKSEEAKKKLDELSEASRKFYATIKDNSARALDKISAETNLRSAQLDITNRMIKAELQLKKARATSSGDARAVESIDRQMAEADRKTAMDKAVGSERDAGSRVKVAEAGLAAAQKAEREANAELKKAEAALVSASKPTTSLMQSSAGSFAMTNQRDTTSEREAVKEAQKRLALAEQMTASARKSVEAEREKWKLAKDNVRTLKAEQKAAEESASSAKLAEGMKAEKDRIAAELKERTDFADAERKRKEKDAEDQRERMKEALDEEVRERNEVRKFELQKDIDADRQRADALAQSLADAAARARDTNDVLGRAGGMDQGGDLQAKRNAAINNERFAMGAVDLIGSGKVKKGADGTWKASGRLSNFNKAVLDRLNAEQAKANAEKEKDKVVKRLDELLKKMDQLMEL